MLLDSLTSALLRQLSPAPAHHFSVECTSVPFAYPAPSSSASSVASLVALFGAFGYSYFPLLCGVGLVRDAQSGAKRQQWLSGTTALPFWSAQVVCDAALYWSSVAVTFGLFAAFDNPLLGGEYFW